MAISDEEWFVRKWADRTNVQCRGSLKYTLVPELELVILGSVLHRLNIECASIYPLQPLHHIVRIEETP